MASAPGVERLRVTITGAVQGVGFRPFVFRLAEELALAGWVVNDTRGVELEVEGGRAALERFLTRVTADAPPAAHIHECAHAWLAPAGFTRFEIRASGDAGARTAALLPELATCADCLAETLDPRERRHRYPFTNCTACGPRFTITRALPYDRPNTTMAGFALCEDCRREYQDPRDRRFHAQPIACPACGPTLALWDRDGAERARGDAALAAAAADLRAGRVVAVKGLGGFHLMCDAADAAAVQRLRVGKGREEKPFAVMARDLDAARALVEVDALAVRALASPEAPIVLLPRRPGAPVADGVAPGLPTLGVMLAYTPLHHLLTRAVERPLVATSGNRSDEPIATDEREALRRLGHLAEAFLVHDRPIERHVDDSVGWVARGAFRLLRRARGFAPLPVRRAREGPCVLAVGPHLKDTVALAVGRQVFVSQHIGDLETLESLDAFERVIADFVRMYEARPELVAHDLHPDYASTRWARAALERLPGARAVGVQHHHAHLAACLAEHGEPGPALGIVWDGTGYGTDGAIWGGEFLRGDARDFERVAHLRAFRLPGGDAAVREPRRAALALMWALEGERSLARDLPALATFGRGERELLGRMIADGRGAPLTTSAGRLFDGLAALLGLYPRVTHEGQAAIALEHAAEPGDHGAYPLPLSPAAPDPAAAPGVLDWGPLVEAVLSDLARGVARGIMAARIHAAFVAAMVEVAARHPAPCVALSGGCFQNRRLLEGAADALEAAGHRVLVHLQVPPNDGGVSLGQVMVAAARADGDARAGRVLRTE